MLDGQQPSGSGFRRRRWTRVLFLLLVAALSLDTLPPGALPSNRPKQWLSACLNRVGLWQGQWMMFAPNPSVNNVWLTAEIHDVSGTKIDWNSPYWPEVGACEKFYRFRFMNYYNRVQSSQYRAAAPDLADYLARTVGGQSSAVGTDAGDSASSDKSSSRAILYANGLTMVSPTDGSLPGRDEIMWVTFSEIIARAE